MPHLFLSTIIFLQLYRENVFITATEQFVNATSTSNNSTIYSLDTQDTLTGGVISCYLFIFIHLALCAFIFISFCYIFLFFELKKSRKRQNRNQVQEETAV